MLEELEDFELGGKDELESSGGKRGIGRFQVNLNTRDHLLESWLSTSPSQDEKLALETIQKDFNVLLKDRLIKLKEYLGTPLIRKRKPDEESTFLNSDNPANPVDISAGVLANSSVFVHGYLKQIGDLERVSVYDEEDVFGMIRKLEAAKSKGSMFMSFWATVQNPGAGIGVEDFRLEFGEMAYGNRQFGVDESGDERGDAFMQSHSDLGETILASKSIRATRDYAKRGIPSHLRPSIWIFYSNPN
ncbi:hypothetical protein BC829DRAFT_434878 [Chytridium lagenaria]|nr:hypothetical protein BC829DRAFT_434878 [Chytridium lagenaria]